MRQLYSIDSQEYDGTHKERESALFEDAKKLGLGYACREVLQILHKRPSSRLPNYGQVPQLRFKPWSGHSSTARVVYPSNRFVLAGPTARLCTFRIQGSYACGNCGCCVDGQGTKMADDSIRPEAL